MQDGQTHLPDGNSTGGVAVITCAVLEMEIEHLARLAPSLRRIERLPQGLHNTPNELRLRLQEAIDAVEEEPAIETIVLGYGLCSRGTEGVTSRRCRIVIPRAHDCITLLLGDKQRYARYVDEHPGTYWYSPGWNKHHVPPGKRRFDLLRNQYVQRYGEDNADFLMQTEQAWFKDYSRAVWVDLGIGRTDEDVAFTRECAEWLGWEFDDQKGDPALLRDLLQGPWDEARFLTLQPGQTLKMTADDRIVEAVDGHAR